MRCPLVRDKIILICDASSNSVSILHFVETTVLVFYTLWETTLLCDTLVESKLHNRPGFVNLAEY